MDSVPINIPEPNQVPPAPKRAKISRKLLIGVPAILCLAAIGTLIFQLFEPGAPPKQAQLPTIQAGAQEPMSRQVMLLAEEIVKDVKPPPTTAALQYAYVASAYADALHAGGQRGAWQASVQILVLLYPDQSDRITEEMGKIAKANSINTATADFSESTHQVIKKYTDRYKNDKHDLVWDGKIPTGPGKWVKVGEADPFTPRAGEWQRWIVSEAITAPAPPRVGSAVDLQELERVRQASAARSGEDVNKINFWGGAPGTESPGGVWQNQVYATIKGDLPSDMLQADMKYSEIQKIVAQTISDAFMECWKVKYTHWTARPSMRIPELVTAMRDPNFPSYVSGHSTISKASADVLSVIAPKYATDWQAMAIEARDSRLSAGIHYEVDNKVGFDIGTEVAKQAKANLKLQELIR